MSEMFHVEIKESSRELSKVERIKLKDYGRFTRLDDVVSVESSVKLSPEDYAIITIHNPDADGGQFDAIVVTDEHGEKFMTGSKTFIKRFVDIWDEMRGDGSNDVFDVEVYKMESNNYKGKYFIGCSIA